MLVGDVLGGPRGEFAADEGLHVRHVGDVARGHLEHHEAAPRLLHQQSLGAEVQQRLPHGRDADAEFGGELVQPQVLARPVGAVEDPPPDVARDVVGQLRPGRELRVRVGTHRAGSC